VHWLISEPACTTSRSGVLCKIVIGRSPCAPRYHNDTARAAGPQFGRRNMSHATR
jgi:hypothetical protein